MCRYTLTAPESFYLELRKNFDQPLTFYEYQIPLLKKPWTLAFVVLVLFLMHLKVAFKVHLKSYISEAVARQPGYLLIKGLQYRCFPMNFAKFLRTPLFIEHLRWLLLYVSRWLSKFRDNLNKLKFIFLIFIVNV